MTIFVIIQIITLFFALTIIALAENPKSPIQTPHHYVLARVALRQICMTNSVGFFKMMGSQNRDKFLEDLWQQVRKNCDQKGNPPFSIKDVKVETMNISEYRTVMITLPTPQFDAEAHMIGIVLRMEVKDFIENKIPEKPLVEYFTLEKGTTFGGPNRTVLCKWDEAGNHLNYGTGPSPTKPEFIKAISKMLK